MRVAIETEAGWLVLTRGVGSMRKHSIGAVLLGPAPDEREGYVPNVVYRCGSLVHAGNLILPYAISDTASRFAVIRLGALLDAMKS